MRILKLIVRNTLRHKLRSGLTLVGIAIVVMAFALLRTVVGAWYSFEEAAGSDRLVVVHRVSFIFTLPYSYLAKIATVPGIKEVSYAVWFQGQYKDPKEFKNFFPRMAVDPETFFSLYPEFIVKPDEMEAFRKERNAVIIGVKTAQMHNLKIGDLIPIKGDIYPGDWNFVVRGIYHGRDRLADETQMFFDWRYLDEQLKRTQPYRAGQVGWYIVRIANAGDISRIEKDVDSIFKNSPAETRTETEKAFNQSFISMYSAVITAMNYVSFIIVGIILLVLANTMAMTVRERTTEYAVLKTLGFTGLHIGQMIAGEALVISILGGVIGLALAIPITRGFQIMFPTLFPLLPDPKMTILLGMAAALLVGLASSFFPTIRISRMSIVEGLRHID